MPPIIHAAIVVPWWTNGPPTALAATKARVPFPVMQLITIIKNLDLAWTHHFVAVVVETAGAMSSDALDFFADIGSQVRVTNSVFLNGPKCQH